MSNLFKRETLSGEFLQINAYLVRELQAHGLWTESDHQRDQAQRGIGAGDRGDPRRHPRPSTARPGSCPMRSLIDMAAGRGAFIDQSQSLNLFMESPTIGKLSSMYLHAWKQGLKTTYYLRSRPATRINKTNGTGSAEAQVPGRRVGATTSLPTATNTAPQVEQSETPKMRRSQPRALRPRRAPNSSDPSAQAGGAATTEYSDEEAVACSLENPESCDACQ